MNTECGNYTLLRQFARELSDNLQRDISYLEIGTNEGGSAAVVMEPLNGVRFAVLVDSWGIECGGTGRGSPDHIVSLLGKAMERTLIITGESKHVLPTLTHKFDLIFVDGDHSAEGCTFDMTQALRLLGDNGILVVDDLDNQHHSYLRNTVTQFSKNNRMTMQAHNVHTGVAELRKFEI